MAHIWESLVSVSQAFSAAMAKFPSWRGDWALGYHSMEFGYIPDIS